MIWFLQVNADAKRLGRRTLKKGVLYYAESLEGVIGEPKVGGGYTLASVRCKSACTWRHCAVMFLNNSLLYAVHRSNAARWLRMKQTVSCRSWPAMTTAS